MHPLHFNLRNHLMFAGYKDPLAGRVNLSLIIAEVVVPQCTTMLSSNCVRYYHDVVHYDIFNLF